MIIKFSFQMSDYTQQKFRLGAIGRTPRTGGRGSQAIPWNSPSVTESPTVSPYWWSKEGGFHVSWCLRSRLPASGTEASETI